MPISESGVVLYDAVTLEHFAAANQLPLLQELHGDRGHPKWVDSVREEVLAGARRLDSQRHCQPVLDSNWLGQPKQKIDLILTMRLRALLADGDGSDETKHLGEAQSIAFAITVQGSFVTDDGPAYDFARKHRDLGAGRVSDACELLWIAHGLNLIDLGAIESFHTKVFDAGRTMRCRCRLWPTPGSVTTERAAAA
jgi:hypothetical protein